MARGVSASASGAEDDAFIRPTTLGCACGLMLLMVAANGRSSICRTVEPLYWDSCTVIVVSKGVLLRRPGGSWNCLAPLSTAHNKDVRSCSTLAMLAPVFNADGQSPVKMYTKTDCEQVKQGRLKVDDHEAGRSNSSIRDGRLLVNGKPYFIWGSYTHDLREVDWNFLRSSGYNTVLSYTNGNASAFVIDTVHPAQIDFRPIRRFMDAAAAHQMKVILNLKDMYNSSLTQDMSRIHCNEQCILALVTAIVAEFKSHNALLGYYLSDETPTNYISMITERQNLVASLDPYHITYFVEQSYTSLSSQAFRQGIKSGTSAVFGVDVYPWNGPRSSVSIGHEGYEQHAMGLAFQGEDNVGLCSAMQTFDMRSLFCGRCQHDNETKWCYRCNATFPPLDVLRAMAFIQPVASHSVGVMQYSYSSAFDSYNTTSQTFESLARSDPIMQLRLHELRAVGLQFRDFIDNEFLWKRNELATNATKRDNNPTVFAASFELPHRGLKTIIVVNGVASCQPVTVNLENGSRLHLLLEPWEVWIKKAHDATHDNMLPAQPRSTHENVRLNGIAAASKGQFASCSADWRRVCPSEPCAPLSTPVPSWEVGGFRSHFGGCHTSPPCTASSWTQYDWRVMSTVVAFTEANMTALACAAHQHNRRVVLSHSHAFGRFNTSRLGDPVYRSEWVRAGIHKMRNMYSWSDGVNLDLEHFPWKGISSSKFVTMQDQLVNMTCEISWGLREIGSRLHSMDVVPWGSWRVFDVARLAKCVDYIVPMAYCNPTARLCIDRGNVAGPAAALDNIKSLIANGNPARGNTSRGFLGVGIPASKILLGLPLYGYDFACTNNAPPVDFPSVRTCLFDDHSPVPVVGLDQAMELFRAQNVTTGPELLYDESFATSWFEYLEPNGQRHQVWIDDSRAVNAKAKWALQTGLHGVVFWTIDTIYDSQSGRSTPESRAVWQALANIPYSLFR